MTKRTKNNTITKKKGQKDKQYNNQKKKDKQYNNQKKKDKTIQ
jgi:hypothetical protein